MTLTGLYWSQWYILECHGYYFFPAQKRPKRALKDRGTKGTWLSQPWYHLPPCRRMLLYYHALWPGSMACTRFRRIMVSTSEWLHGWSVAKLMAIGHYWHTTDSHTQSWLIPSRVDVMNILLRCAHVQQWVWCRSVFPTVSCLPYWNKITVPACEYNSNRSCCWRSH